MTVARATLNLDIFEAFDTFKQPYGVPKARDAGGATEAAARMGINRNTLVSDEEIWR